MIPSADNIHFGGNTTKYKDLAIYSYGYKLICVDDRYSKLYETYFVEDAIDRFLNDQRDKKW